VETFAELKSEGLVRHIGVSNFEVAQLRRAQAIAPVETLQPPYSLIERSVEEEIMPFADVQGIGIVIYSPTASTGRHRRSGPSSGAGRPRESPVDVAASSRVAACQLGVAWGFVHAMRVKRPTRRSPAAAVAVRVCGPADLLILDALGGAGRATRQPGAINLRPAARRSSRGRRR
jgi:diketogulonate reductase-like aldo/keto reductase